LIAFRAQVEWQKLLIAAGGAAAVSAVLYYSLKASATAAGQDRSIPMPSLGQSEFANCKNEALGTRPEESKCRLGVRSGGALEAPFLFTLQVCRRVRGALQVSTSIFPDTCPELHSCTLQVYAAVAPPGGVNHPRRALRHGTCALPSCPPGVTPPSRGALAANAVQRDVVQFASILLGPPGAFGVVSTWRPQCPPHLGAAGTRASMCCFSETGAHTNHTVAPCRPSRR
jgi:hypothetical protein